MEQITVNVSSTTNRKSKCVTHCVEKCVECAFHSSPYPWHSADNTLAP